MPNDLFRRLPISLAVLQALSMWNTAYALPSGEAVQAGLATFQRNGQTLRIDQGSGRAIVNFQSFNIGANEAVNVFQPNHGTALFRILGPDASQIFGSLTATGSLFLTNPNGILFAPGSRVDVGSLVATAMRISNADFMAGNYQFTAEPGQLDSAVVNQGVIRAADGGYLVLLGSKVENSGTLQANNGSVVLGSAQSAMLDFYGDGLVRVNLSGDALNAAITQTGNISASGGAVQLAANARTAALNIGGVIQANSLVERNGVIRLEGGTGSKVKVAGKLEARGDSAGTQGGNVVITGEQVALLDSAAVDVSGQAGGGTALIGGDYQGKNAAVQNARTTYIANGAKINANAITQGDGGKIVIWSNDTTRYYGNISAQGGKLSGNGGFIEVSGKQNLDFHGGIDVGAVYGTGGRVLLDPQDILLNNAVQPSPPNNANGTPDVTFADPPAAGTYIVQIADVTGYSELFLQATRNITVANAIAMAANNSIRLEANNNITLNAGASVTVSGTGSINLKADADVSGAGALSLNAALASQQGGITLSGASLTGAAAGTITTTGAANLNGGNVSINTTGAVSLLGAITTNGGAGAAATAGGNAGNVGIIAAGMVSTATITASGGNAGAGNAAGGNAGAINISTNTGNITSGALTARTGNATGTGASGAVGSISVINTAAAGNVTLGALTTTGGANGNGGNISANASGLLTLNGAIASTGGANVAATTQAGKNAGTVTFAGNGITTLAAATINANGGAGVGANQNGGNAGLVILNSTGALLTQAINSQTGTATGTGAGGTIGGVALSGTSVIAGALTTTGGANGNAGNISATSTTGNLGVGAIAASGGVAQAGAAGRNAGTVTLNSAGAIAATTITANGSGGNGALANLAGGNGAAISIFGASGVTTTAIGASGSAGTTNNGNGGNAGSITIANSGSGNIGTTTLTAQVGNAAGTGTGGTAGSIAVTNSAAGGNITTSIITTAGATNAHGGNVTLASQGNVTVTGTVTSSGGAAGVGVTASGRNAGTVSISGVNRSITGSIIANGGAGLGANQAGGNAGAVSITGSGTLGTAAINSQTGAATGTGISGTVGNITLTGNNLNVGALTTIGGSNGNGGTVSINTTGTLAAGAISTSGGTALAGNAGRNAGNVTVNAGRAITALGTITASGSAGVLAGDHAGGNGAAVSITSVGGIAAAAIAANGGAAAGTNANGGNAGSITIANSGSGNISSAALGASTGAAVGTGAGGNQGLISVINNAAGGNLSTISVTTAGGTNAHGGNVVLSSQGNVTATGAIISSGGAAGVGVTASGRNAGTVNITGVNRSISGAIAANGGAASGANQAGGKAGAVSITGSGTLATAAINSQTGNATGTAAGGSTGGIALSGTSVIAGALTTTGGNNGNAGNISATSTIGNLGVGAVAASGGAAQAGTAGRNAGTVTLNSAGSIAATTIATNASAGNGTGQAGGAGNTISLAAAGAIAATTLNASGGNASAAGNANGGIAGDITLDAGGATPNITLGGNITATGGNRVGTGIAGNGGTFWAKDATTNTANVIVNTAGGTVGGVGGNIRFDGALNEDATARTLTLTAGIGAVMLAGGAPANALTTLSSTGASNTLGSVQTKGAQTYTGVTNLNGALATLGTAGADTITFNSPVTLTGNSSLTTAGGINDNISIVQTVNGNFNLALNAGALGNVTTSAVIGGTTGLNAFSATGAAVTFGRSVKASSILGQSTNGNITLNNAGTVLTGTGSGNAIVLAASANFINSVGAGALTTPFGRWLVYSTDPGLDTRGGLTYNFKQYNAPYPAAAAQPGGNGFLYALAPIITPSLSGSASRVYDGGITAPLAGLMVNGSGAVDGDTLALTPGSASYNNKNVGVSKPVTANGITLAASNGAATVYGYQLSGTSASANVGTITAAALSLNAVTDSRTYNGNTSSAGAVVTAGLVGGDSVSGLSQSFASKNVLGVNGSTLMVNGGFMVNDGNLGGNYSVTQNTALGTINKADITAVIGITAADKIYDGNTSAALNTMAAGFTGIVGGETLTVGAAIGTFNSKDVLTASTVNISGITLGNGTGLASNYNLTTTTASTGANITPRPVTITADVGQVKFFGNADPLFTFTIGGLGLGAGDALSGNLSRVTGESVGMYAINSGTLALLTPSNYILTYVSNDFNILQPPTITTGLPRNAAGLVDANPKFGAYTGPQLFILSLAPTAAGGNGDNASATLPQCETTPDKLARDKDFSILINFGLNLPQGLNNTCI